MKTPVGKKNENIKRQFTEEVIQRANKHIKSCIILFIVKEMD